MKCDEFEVQLHEVLDRRERLAADPFLARHAKVCTACQRKIHLYEALFDGLDLSETPVLAADFSQQITQAAKVRPRAPWKRITAVCVAVAASLLVMVAVANRSGAPDKASTPEGELAESQAAPAPRTARKPRRKQGTTPRTFAGIAPGSSAAQENAAAQSASPSGQEFDELLKELPFASQGISLAETSAATTRLPGFRPFASSVTTAFSALRQTLPGGRNEEQPDTKPQARFYPMADTRHA